MHTIINNMIEKQNKNKISNGVTPSTSLRGFTIVELIVVIVIIGILASISIVSYGNWQQSVVTAQLKSDLSGVATAMESYRNFNNGYPASIPSTFTPSAAVTITGGSDDGGKTYCIDAVNSKFPSLYYHIDFSSSVALSGPCPERFTLTIIAGTGGTVNTSGIYNSGTSQIVTATPNTNYVFSSWSGSTGCSGVASHTITIDSNKTCTANFVAYVSPYIQTITAASCPLTRTQVQDARDSHTYWVQKLADGNCWMLTNLGYAGSGTNTYNDIRTLTDGTGGSTTYTVASYYAFTVTTNFTTEPTAPSVSTDGSGQYGYLYNWCAAMGGQATAACANATTPTPVTTTSICPSGWRLPIGGSGGEFVALNTAINGGSTTTDAGLIGTPWLAQRGGMGGGSFFYQVSNGYYWSSTQNLASSVYILDFSSANVHPDTSGSGVKYGGFAVRCIAG